MEIKALSIIQPWAWAILYAGKWIENRTWPTKNKGWFLIHAGKSWDQAGYEFLTDVRRLTLPPRDEIKTGGVVGLAYLSNCITASPSRWFDGPYGFVLALARPIEFYACPGQLSFFNIDVTPRLLASIEKAVDTFDLNDRMK